MTVITSQSPSPQHPYHLLANSMVWLSEMYPRPLLRPIPTWFRELTFKPVSDGTEKSAAKKEAAA